MKKQLLLLIIASALSVGCSTTGYKARPVPFKAPQSSPNMQEVAGALVAATAYVGADEAKEAFGFNIRAAGMLPVQVVFDNRGSSRLEVYAAQTFLEDQDGNLWPILPREMAYERAAKYAKTKEIFKEGAYHGFLGAAAGAVIGAAVGIVSGENVAESAGKGAVVGAAAGATLGGAAAYGTDGARRTVIGDLQDKSLNMQPIPAQGLAYGFLFFPGEAQSARQLRLHVVESETGVGHVILLTL